MIATLGAAARVCVAAALVATPAAAFAGAEIVGGLSASTGFEFGVPAPRPNWIVGTRIGAAAADVSTLVPLGAMGDVGGPGYTPKGAVADPHGRNVYYPRGSILVVDSTGGAPPSTIAFDVPVYRVAADPSGARLYALSSQPGFSLVTIDVRTRRAIASTTLLEAGNDLAVSPDGRYVWVLGSSNMLSLVDTRERTLVRRQVPGDHARAIAFDPARRRLYVAKDHEQRIDVLFADTLDVERSFPLDATPYDVLVGPTNGLLYVDTGPLLALDPASGEVVARSGAATGVVASPDGTLLYRAIAQRCGPGEPYEGGCSSQRIVALDTRTLAPVGDAALDSRTTSDSSWGMYHAVANFVAAAPRVTQAVEYFNARLGHYFLTALPVEIDKLDRGEFAGWQRTGESIPVYMHREDGPSGTTPVCRFYGRPEKGLDSHFYSASPAECAEVLARFGDSWMLEASDVFYGYLPDAASGACPFETTPVYRLYNDRPDANHRYTTSADVRSAMVAQGWIAEGYGPDAVGLCVPR